MADMTDWYPASVNPARPGEYEVRNGRPLSHNNKARLLGNNRRYWDGEEWWCASPLSGFPTIFGTHDSHQWRGLTRAAYLKAGGK